MAIGEPHFFGAEHLLTGASKAALSQITGEINVLSGLDAGDALNPGRESFYEENEQYKILRYHLVGEGDHVTGYLGQAIGAVRRRSQVRSVLKDVLGHAVLRRRVLDTEHLSEAAEIDHDKGEVRIDTSRPEWDWTLVLFDRRVRVVNKR